MGALRWTLFSASLAAALLPAHAQTQSYGSAGSYPGTGLRIEQRSPWTFQASGLVSHFREPSCDSCSYRTAVPGIGLQREFRPAADTPLRFALAGGLQNDSFGDSGGYAAAVASLLWKGESVAVRPGLGGFAFYRYMGDGDGGLRDSAGREIVPAILPVLSIEGIRSGFGATLLVAPNFSWAGRGRSGFVFLQFSYRLGGGGIYTVDSGEPSSRPPAQASFADLDGRPVVR